MLACIHTNDKHYKLNPSLQASEFSSLNIGDHKLIKNLNALNNRVWDTSEPVYWQLDSEYEFLTYDEQVDIIKKSVLETSLLTDLKIRQKRKQTGDAHIKINWLGAKDEKYFRGKKGTLGFAYGPQKGIGGDVTMNADQLWLLRKTPLTAREAIEKGYIENASNPDNHVKYYDPIHTMKHECGGHACGMRHITNIDERFRTVMYPYYNGIRKFSQADIDYLLSLYQGSSYWKRAQDYFSFYIQRF